MDRSQYIKSMSGAIFAFLLIWVGVTGRLGSLLGALITPDFMVNGIENLTPATGNSGGSSFGATTNPQSLLMPSPITGTQLSIDQVANLAFNAGVRTQTALATSIAICDVESGFRSDAVGGPNQDGSYDYGLWQINSAAHPQYSKAQMFDPTQNAAAMYYVSSSGTNWSAWTSYANGNYQQYMANALSAAQNAIQRGGGGV